MIKTNVYDARFVNNENDKVFHVKQYANTEKEIKDFWTNYFNKGRDKDKYTFIDVILIMKDIEVTEEKYTKWLHVFDNEVKEL